MPTPSTWLSTINWGTSSGGSAGSAETTSTLGTAVADLVVPPDQYHVGNLRIENMRQLLIAMSGYFKGGTRIQVLAQTSNPFSSGEVGFYSDNAATKQPRYYDGTTLKYIASGATTAKADLLVFDGSAFQKLAVGSNTQVLTADSTTATGLKWAAGGGGSATIATAYSNGASSADSIITLDSTRAQVVIKDAAMTVSNLFDVVNNGATTRYLRITSAAAQEIKSGMADGASAVAAFVDTTSAWSNATAKLFSLRNNNTEKAYFLQTGSLVVATTADVTARHALANASSTAPSLTAGTAMGTTPTGLSISGTDETGEITFTVGTSPPINGTLFTLTYGTAFPAGSAMSLHPANSAAASLWNGFSKDHGYYLTSGTSTSTYEVTTGALTASTQYKFKFVVRGW